MSEEIKEKLDLFPNKMNDIAKEDYYQLEDYITNLQQKVEQLEKENEKLKQENKRIFQNVNDDELLISNAMNYAEVQRLNNIINELEKEIINQIEICKEGQVLETKARSPFDTYSGDIRAYKYLLYKLKELKEE